MQAQAINSPVIQEQPLPYAVATVSNLNKSFTTKVALKNLNLSIQANQVLAILGANGAGKTTLINILLGRLQADSGDIDILGHQAGDIVAKRQTGAMLQVANLPETLKIKEHIQLFQSYYPNPMAYEQVIAYAGLQDLQQRYSRKLSGGEKQRLLFALSICGNPKLLFLDEPSVGMDVEARQGLWQAIRDLKSRGTAIVLTTHYLQEAESLADQIVLLKNGEIIKKGNNDDFKASVSHKLIRFCSKLQYQNFANLPAVVMACQSGKYTTLQSTNTNQSLFALLALDPDIEDLTVQGAGLEEAFLHLNNNEQSAVLHAPNQP